MHITVHDLIVTGFAVCLNTLLAVMISGRKDFRRAYQQGYEDGVKSRLTLSRTDACRFQEE
jgi:hypothetical protein